MQTYFSEAPHRFAAGSTAVAIGAFDGVHIGHRSLISRLVELAAARSLQPGVVSFDRHPASIVRPDTAPRLLTDTAQKVELLSTTGLDWCEVITFDESRSLELAEDFVRDTLVDQLGVGLVVVGADFHFGNGRKGDVSMLTRLGNELGFDMLGITLVPDVIDGEAVSSTRIRGLLGDGQVQAAARLLDRDHEVRGVVVHGDARGRTLGFPTANVMVPGNICLPADGVYAGWYLLPDGTRHATAISVGRRPTFYQENGVLLVEAHLLNFDDDLYDQPARVQFSHWIRGQVKFDGVDALVAQLQQDVAATAQLQI
jgi:riboflavin kinase/FMN adenylyltransferase